VPFFTAAAERLQKNNESSSGMSKSALLAQATIVAGRAATALYGQPASEAIKGYLALLAQYAIANQLERYGAFRGQPGVTAKNRVAYLSRIKLHETINAVSVDDQAVIKNSWDGELFSRLCIKAADEIAHNLELDDRSKGPEEAFAKVHFPLESGEAGLAQDLTKIVKGFEVKTIGPRDYLKLDGAQNNGESLIPLEDRALGLKIGGRHNPRAIKSQLSALWDQTPAREKAKETPEEEMAAKLDHTGFRSAHYAENLDDDFEEAHREIAGR
jgi:hypothetical protein